MKDAGYLMLVIWFKVQRSGFLVWSIGVLECWMLVTGCSILDTGYWSLVRGKFNRLIVPPVRPVRLCLARLVASRRAFKGWLTPLNRLIV